MNKKGFTLIELLATLVILSILMTVAVSSVLNVVDSNRRETYVEDAKKFVSQVEYNIRANKLSIKKPSVNNCIAISLDYIDATDFEKAPSGGRYDETRSFVVLKNVNYEDKYYVRLVESIDGKSFRGIAMVDIEDIKGGKGKPYVLYKDKKDLFVVSTGEEDKISQALSGIGVSCGSITVYSK